MGSSLGPASRAAAMRAMSSDVLDLLVVGAGATGTGTALDAASRGLSRRPDRQGRHRRAAPRASRASSSTAACATCSRATSLSCASRCASASCCSPPWPRISSRPLPFMLPLTHRVWERPTSAPACWPTTSSAGPGPCRAIAICPSGRRMRGSPICDEDALVGALQYYDAQMDDARLARGDRAHRGARGRARRAAHVAGRAAGRRGRRRPPRGRARRAHAARSSSSRPATSPSASACGRPRCRRCSPRPTTSVGIIRSKGVHLRLPRSAIDGDTALIVPTGKSVLFVMPSPTHWLVGTTDTEWLGDPDAVEPTPEDIEYLLGPAERRRQPPGHASTT